MPRPTTRDMMAGAGRVGRRMMTIKSMDKLQKETSDSKLIRSLNAFDLTCIGVGITIGVGIFVMTGTAAGEHAGPALVLSFILASLICGLTGLCYAEMAAMIPSSGSAYTYAYATMGEFLAWLIAWCLILEYICGGATIAVGWSDYFVKILKLCGASVKPGFVNAPVRFDELTQSFMMTGHYINLPAISIVCLCTIILCVGLRESKMANHVFVGIKVLVIIIFLCATWSKIDPQNWVPFIPPRDTVNERYGVMGIFKAVTVIFIAYIGFDAVATTAQETRNPSRDLPIGILCSLLICTILYVLVTLNLTGIYSYKNMVAPGNGAKAPLAAALEHLEMYWLVAVVSVGAVAGLTSAVTVNLMAQPRIFYAMAMDGLLPPSFAHIHPRFGTPIYPTIASGMVCAIIAGVCPIEFLGHLTSAGTLFAFALVCISVSILRFTRPDIERPFRVPLGPILIPGLGALSCVIIICLNVHNLCNLACWILVGIVVYFSYGYHRSHLRVESTKPVSS